MASSNPASSPPSPALMTMPNSRVLFRLIRSSTASGFPAGAASSLNAIARLESRAPNSGLFSLSRPADAACRNMAVAPALNAATPGLDFDGFCTLLTPLVPLDRLDGALSGAAHRQMRQCETLVVGGARDQHKLELPSCR